MCNRSVRSGVFFCAYKYLYKFLLGLCVVRTGEDTDTKADGRGLAGVWAKKKGTPYLTPRKITNRYIWIFFKIEISFLFRLG